MISIHAKEFFFDINSPNSPDIYNSFYQADQKNYIISINAEIIKKTQLLKRIFFLCKKMKHIFEYSGITYMSKWNLQD
jgi:hypothetical protein